MSISNGPNLGKMINATTGDAFDIDFRALLRAFDALLQAGVISRALSAPPGSPADGDRYIIGGSPSGAWAGAANSITCWTMNNPAFSSGHWELFAPKPGWIVYSVADAAFYYWSGSAWTALSTGGGGGGSSTLAGDSDVVISSPSNGDLLTYDTSTSKWINAAAAGGGGGGGSANITPDTHPSSPASIDDEFEAGSLDLKWTQVNSPTLALLKGSLVLSTPSTGGNNANYITQPIPTAPYRVACKVKVNFWSNANQIWAGLVVTDGTKIWIFGPSPLSGSWYIYWRLYTNFTTQFAFHRDDVVGGNFQITYPDYVAIYDDGTDVHFQISYDGLTWIDLWTQASGQFDSSGPTSWTPTAIGVGIDPGTTTSGVVRPVAFDWFRKLL